MPAYPNGPGSTPPPPNHRVNDHDVRTTLDKDSHRFLYTGRRLDPGTRLQYSRYRYYHPQLGRWINRDPIGYDGGTYNLYEYVYGMPTRATDPTGLAFIAIDPGPVVAPIRPKPNPGGTNEDSFDDLIGAVLPDEKGIVSACASMPIGAIPPFGVVEGKACADGSIKKCRKKDGSLGAMLCGEISASISARFPPVPTAPSVQVHKDPDGSTHVSEIRTKGNGEQVRERCPKRKYFSPIDGKFDTGGDYTYSSDDLPPCETKTTGEIKLEASCTAGGIIASGTVTQPIGGCKFPGGCYWGGRPKGDVDIGWCKPHASCSLTGSGKIEGCINLTPD